MPPQLPRRRSPSSSPSCRTLCARTSAASPPGLLAPCRAATPHASILPGPVQRESRKHGQHDGERHHPDAQRVRQQVALHLGPGPRHPHRPATTAGPQDQDGGGGRADPPDAEFELISPYGLRPSVHMDSFLLHNLIRRPDLNVGLHGLVQ